MWPGCLQHWEPVGLGGFWLAAVVHSPPAPKQQRARTESECKQAKEQRMLIGFGEVSFGTHPFGLQRKEVFGSAPGKENV